MLRRLTIVGVVSLLLLNNLLFAGDYEGAPSDEDVGSSLTVIMDCISASLVTECTDTTIKLPCSNVLMDRESRLPRRIAYFLADPAEYVRALSPADPAGGFFASFMSILNSAAENPLVSAVYVNMSTRDYRPAEYLLSGSISFKYPEGSTLDEVLTLWSSRESTGREIVMTVDIQVFGSALATPISLAGVFNMSVDEEGSIVVKSTDTYTINGFAYDGGEYRM